MTPKKKLIEVAPPLVCINKAAARAVISVRMVDAPSAHPVPAASISVIQG